MLALALCADGTPATIVVDGVTYRVATVDSSGRLLVALDLTAISPPTTVANGQKTVTAAGTAEQLPSVACKGASIAALPTNTGNVYLGDSAVSSANGRPLQPGEPLDVAIANLNAFYLDADVNGEGISYLALS